MLYQTPYKAMLCAVFLNLKSWREMMRKFLICAMLISYPCNAQDFISPLAWPVTFLDRRPPELPSDLYKYEDTDESEAGESSTENSVKLAQLTYSPSTFRTRTNLQVFLDKARATSPEQANKMEALFASTDVIGEIGKVMVQNGLRTNNTADAFVLYWINAWSAVNGDSSSPSVQAVNSVAAQAAQGFANSPEFAKTNDAEKQQMAESFMVHAALIDAYMNTATSDPAKMRALRTAVLRGARASGLDLDSMMLTENGFVPAKEK